jgi:hypothetical protein
MINIEYDEKCERKKEKNVVFESYSMKKEKKRKP